MIYIINIIKYIFTTSTILALTPFPSQHNQVYVRATLHQRTLMLNQGLRMVVVVLLLITVVALLPTMVTGTSLQAMPTSLIGTTPLNLGSRTHVNF